MKLLHIPYAVPFPVDCGGKQMYIANEEKDDGHTTLTSTLLPVAKLCGVHSIWVLRSMGEGESEIRVGRHKVNLLLCMYILYDTNFPTEAVLKMVNT